MLKARCLYGKDMDYPYWWSGDKVMLILSRLAIVQCRIPVQLYCELEQKSYRVTPMNRHYYNVLYEKQCFNVILNLFI